VSGIFVVAPGIAVLFVLHPNQSILTWLERMGRWFSIRDLVKSTNPYILPVFLLAWLAAVLLPIVVHEAVHALAGIAVGFKLKILTIWPFQIEFQGARPRLCLARTGNSFGSCHVKMLTVIGAHRKYFFFAGMAPLANLIMGGSIVVAWRLGAFEGLSASIRHLVAGFAFISTLGGLGSAVPVLNSDGARLWMIATNSPKCRRWLSLLALKIQRANGTPSNHLNRRWIRNACSVDDGSQEDLDGHWMAYLSANANNDVGSVAIHLESCLRHAPIATDEFVNRMRAAASMYHAECTRDAVKAEKWFNEMRPLASLSRILQIRTLVPLRLAQNRRDEALAQWDEGLTVIKSCPPAQREPLEKSWTAWKVEILKRCAGAEETTPPDSSDFAK
jgi:hypothetical protein